MSGEVWDEVYDRLAQFIRQHKTNSYLSTRAGWPSESRVIWANASATKISRRITAASLANSDSSPSSD